MINSSGNSKNKMMLLQLKDVTLCEIDFMAKFLCKLSAVNEFHASLFVSECNST